MDTLDKYIVTIPKLLPAEFCTKLVAEYSNDPYLECGKRVDGENSITRTCSELPTFHYFSIPGRKELDEELFSYVTKGVNYYRDVFPHCRLAEDTGYVYVQYKEGQYFQQHTDKFFKSRGRSMTISIALNEDFEGGEWAWFDRELVKRFKTGDAVMFPSSWLFPHEIMPVLKGTRHAMVTWFLEG
jgi:predicted 2-oxoglutarate/Fe(II)-dependent dioxygenase YbiX